MSKLQWKEYNGNYFLISSSEIKKSIVIAKICTIDKDLYDCTYISDGIKEIEIEEVYDRDIGAVKKHIIDMLFIKLTSRVSHSYKLIEDIKELMCGDEQ